LDNNFFQFEYERVLKGSSLVQQKENTERNEKDSTKEEVYHKIEDKKIEEIEETRTDNRETKGKCEGEKNEQRIEEKQEHKKMKEQQGSKQMKEEKQSVEQYKIEEQNGLKRKRTLEQEGDQNQMEKKIKVAHEEDKKEIMELKKATEKTNATEKPTKMNSTISNFTSPVKEGNRILAWFKHPHNRFYGGVVATPCPENNLDDTCNYWWVNFDNGERSQWNLSAITHTMDSSDKERWVFASEAESLPVKERHRIVQNSASTGRGADTVCN